jgi:hypothetical protein
MALLLIILVAITGVFFVPATQTVETSRVCVQDFQGNCVPEPADGWIPVSFDGFEGVIVPAEDAGEDGWFSSDEAWTPTEEDVVAAEEAIEAEQGPLDHMRQYIGVTQDGERKIFVNGFCDAWETNWQAELIFVNDGGDCFFGATYNVETGELESFTFNGEA